MANQKFTLRIIYNQNMRNKIIIFVIFNQAFSLWKYRSARILYSVYSDQLLYSSGCWLLQIMNVALLLELAKEQTSISSGEIRLSNFMRTGHTASVLALKVQFQNP